MLARAWGFLGLLSATLVMAGFFLTLRHAGWQPGLPTGPGSRVNLGYRQATTVAWLGIVACQADTAFVVRAGGAPLRQVGVFSNKPLLGGIAVALVFAALVVYLLALHRSSAPPPCPADSPPPSRRSRSSCVAPTKILVAGSSEAVTASALITAGVRCAVLGPAGQSVPRCPEAARYRAGR